MKREVSHGGNSDVPCCEPQSFITEVLDLRVTFNNKVVSIH